MDRLPPGAASESSSITERLIIRLHASRRACAAECNASSSLHSTDAFRVPFLKVPTKLVDERAYKHRFLARSFDSHASAPRSNTVYHITLTHGAAFGAPVARRPPEEGALESTKRRQTPNCFSG